MGGKTVRGKKKETSVLATRKKIIDDEDIILEKKEELEGWNELIQSTKKEKEMSKRKKEIKEIRSFLDTLLS